MKGTQQATDWYRHPAYYEAIFGTDTTKEFDFLEAMHARHGNGGRRWLEPACGAGRLIEEGARRGLTMFGYDLSDEMLAFARARLTPTLRRRVTLTEGDMATFFNPELEGRFDVAFNLVSTFRYLDSDEAACAHLRNTRRLLAPDGRYFLGFHLTDYARSDEETERWKGEIDGAAVDCFTWEGPPDRKRRRAPMTNRLRVRGPDVNLDINTEWNFRTWSSAEARSLFSRTGFRVLARHDFDYRPDRLAASDRLDSIFVLAPSEP